MSYLNIEKLNKLKKEFKLSNKKISELTMIPIATVDRFFSGANSNPSIELLQKITALFNCTIDDVVNYKNVVQIKKTTNKQAEEIANNICNNKKLLNLYSKIEDSNVEDLDFLLIVANKICNRK